MYRRIWPFLICLAACGWAIMSFDWRMVGVAFLRFDVGYFLLVGLPVGLMVFVVRSLRWAAVAGMPFTPGILWQTHVQTALAIATAAATPLQAGEALKLKFAHDTTGADYASLGAAFAVERLADIAVVFGLGALGFVLRGSSGTSLLLATLMLVFGVAMAPLALRRLARAPLPARFREALAPLAHYRPTLARMLILGVCTVAKWIGVVLLWQATFAAAGVSLGIGDCAVTVALVTLTVTLSLVPGGIGVAEVSTRAILVWLGIEPGLADGAAVMLRLLMPLIIGIGLLHGIAWLFREKVEKHG